MSKYHELLKEAQLELTEYVISQLEAGLSWSKCWETSDGRWPTSISSGELYKGGNLLWLAYAQMKKGYNSSDWGTFNAWKEKGGKVIKGEKSTRIIFYKPIVKEEAGEQKVFFALKSYSVFNRNQIQDLPESAPLAESNDSLIKCDSGVLFQYIENQNISIIDGSPAYIPSRDSIRLPKSYTKEAEGWSAVAHEIIHSTGAENRLAREGVTKPSGLHEYSYEELIAELGSLFLCSQLGLSTDESKENSAAYISSWAKRLQSNPDWIWRASGEATKAVAFVESIINQQKGAVA